MDEDTRSLLSALSAKERYVAVQFFREGNNWLSFPFIAVTTINGAKFALFSRNGNLNFLPANASTFRGPIVVEGPSQIAGTDLLLKKIEEIEKEQFTSATRQVPSFVKSNPRAKSSSEALHNFRFNWFIPIFSGGLIFLLAFVVSIGSSLTPSTGPALEGNSTTTPIVQPTIEPSGPNSNTIPTEKRPFYPSEKGDHVPGSLVTCQDGTTSSSGGKKGACSWHGGVR